MDSTIAYLIVFLSVMVEGELVLLTSALASQKGFLNIYGVGLMAFLGTLIVDWGLFFTGRYLGRRLFDKFTFLKHQSSKPTRWIRQNPELILVFYRFLYGFRIVTLLLLGISHVAVRKFMIYSLVATVLWTIIFSVIGYYTGEFIGRFIMYFENVWIYLFMGMILMILLLIIIRNVIRRVL